MTTGLAIDVVTPPGLHVRCTDASWLHISTVKHPVLAGRRADVAQVLADPDEIRVSRKDPDVLLFYRGQPPRWLCAVIKCDGDSGFLITAYPTDAVKAGERRWTRSV